MHASLPLLRKLAWALFTLLKRGASGILSLISGLWKALRSLSSTFRPAPEKDVEISGSQQCVFFCASSSPSLEPWSDGPPRSDEHQMVRFDGESMTSNVINPGWARQEIGSNSNQNPAACISEGVAYHVHQDHTPLSSDDVSIHEAAPNVNPQNSDNAIHGRTDEITLETTRPSALGRYDRKIKVPAKEPVWVIDKLVKSDRYKRKQPQDSGWTSCAHPEGLLYHRGEVDGTVYYTDVDVCDAMALRQVQRVIKKLQEDIEKENQALRTGIKVSEVVLEAKDSENGIWEYYIVDHESQHLFWLGKHQLQTGIYIGAESAAHIGQLLKYEYYMHLSYFPHKQKVNDAFFAELKGILVWYLTDSLTSIDSLAPYDVTTMENFLKLINHMQDLSEKVPEYSVAAGARLRLVFETSKFDNFSGLPCARLTRSQSVRGEGREDPSLLFRLVSFLFFEVPAKYLKLLDGLYMDNVVFQAPFRIFVVKTSNVWQQDVINAAVLFTANIAFLAIPTLLPESGEINAAATASIVSIIFSLSSIIFGQLLSKKIQALQEESTTNIASYFVEWWSTKSGLSELAIMYSLPYVLMIWGAIAFMLAIFIFSFRHFRINAQNLVILVFLAASTLLCLWIVLEISGWEKFKSPLRKLLVKLGILKDTDPDRPPNIIRRATLKFGSVVKAVKFIGIVRRRRDETTNSQGNGLDQAEA